MKKFLSLALALVITASIAGCGGKSNETTDNGSKATESTTNNNNSTNTDNNSTDSGSGGEETPAEPTDPPYVAPASDVSGELTIMMWAGDGSYMQDLGHQNYTPEDLLGQNQAAAYATAKAFNEVYPNVKINIFAKSGDPNSDGLTWAQHIENFKAEYGKYPDLYAATDLPGDIEKGMCADISIFSHDPVYQSFNSSVMAMMNFNGAQVGLPQYLLPWGVYVNKSLANANNIDIPNPDWTIDDYTTFTANHEPDVYYGAMDAPLDFLRTGSQDFSYSLVNRKPGDKFVSFDSDSMKKLLEYIPKWANNAVHPQNDLGLVSGEFMSAGDWWGYNYFKNGKLLTYAGDPWMMGDAAHPSSSHWGVAQFDEWDIYPRPSTDYVGNTVGVVLDPFSVHNYAMDDGDPALNDAEYDKLQIAYEFAKFWCGDTRAMQARADQMFNDQGNLKTSLNDSFPLVTGEEFSAQMEIWYSAPTHQRFSDKDKMPGFQYLLELWEAGQFWDISDKAYVWRYEYEGAVREIVYEWLNCWNRDVTGATRTDANWLDQMYSKLPDWNEAFNQRFADKFKSLDAAVTKYYGK